MADREKRCEKCLRRIAFIGWFMGNPQWVHAEASRFPYGHVAVPEVEQPESLAFVNTLFHSDPEAHISAAGATARRAIAKKIDTYLALAATRLVVRRRSAEALAKLFHEKYERLAPQFAYETREASAVPWEKVPIANRELMIATAGSVLHTLVERSDRLSSEEPDEYSVQLPLCPLAPPGWVCTRGAGHDGQGGPCAAIPLPNTVRLLPAVPQPGQNSCTKKQGETRE